MQALEETVAGGKGPVQALDGAAAQATKGLQDHDRRVGE